MMSPKTLECWRTRLPRVIAGASLVAGVLVGGGCATQEPIVADCPSCELQQQELRKSCDMKTAELSESIKQRDDDVALLQLRLLEKQAEINQLTLAQQVAVQEVVRAKAKLRSHISKAEVVARIAEVKLLLKELDPEALSEQQKRAYTQSVQMLELSEQALNEGNIEGASYLSNQSVQQIQPVRNQLTNRGELTASATASVFAIPLQLTVLKRCNVRKSPDMESAVLYQLPGGKKITAFAYDRNWVQIEDGRNGRGWIYYELLGLPK